MQQIGNLILVNKQLQYVFDQAGKILYRFRKQNLPSKIPTLIFNKYVTGFYIRKQNLKKLSYGNILIK